MAEDLTIEEAADLLRVSTKTVLALVRWGDDETEIRHHLTVNARQLRPALPTPRNRTRAQRAPADQ
jgi:excisionase family DNA binding protein